MRRNANFWAARACWVAIIATDLAIWGVVIWAADAWVRGAS